MLARDRARTSLVVEASAVCDLDDHESVEGRGVGQAEDLGEEGREIAACRSHQTIVWFSATSCASSLGVGPSVWPNERGTRSR